MSNEDVRKQVALTTVIRNSMDQIGRHYVVSDEVLGSYQKKYNYLDNDVKMMRFAAGSYGTLSDTYILYAIAMLGFCERISIQNFLFALSQKNANLSIYDPTQTDALRERLKTLVDNGFLFRSRYDVDAQHPDTGKLEKFPIVLYTVDDGAQVFMNHKLGFHIVSNKWLCAKSLEDQIAWAASSYVISNIALDKGFVKFRQGIFRCRELKTVMMTSEVVTHVNDVEYAVACFPAFLHQNRSRQTADDYRHMKKERAIAILQYMLARYKEGKDPYVVIACENQKDMLAMLQLILEYSEDKEKDDSLLTYIGRIFFVGEGAIRDNKTNVHKCFLQLQQKQGGYDFVASKPPFMTGELNTLPF